MEDSIIKPRLIIVGASGVIGSALLSAAVNAGRKVVATGNSRTAHMIWPLDIRTERLQSLVPDLSANDVVFLLAGYSAPGWIFDNPDEARALNFDASRRLADEAFAAGARVVFASTDQVFDGKRGGFLETDATHPLNLYGRLKAIMEECITAVPGLGFVARMGWTVPWDATSHCGVTQCYNALLSPNARMAYDNCINITDVDDVARGMLAMADNRPPLSPIYHLVGAPELSRVALADIIRGSSRFGAAMEYASIPFSSLPYTEPRPVRAFMRSARLEELGLAFSDARDVVRRKVALLDEWRASQIAPNPIA